MPDPITDPRAPGPVPDYVLAAAAREFRGAAHEAAVLCERLARSGRDPELRELARAMQVVCYRAANLGVAASAPVERVGVVRRVWRAIVG